MRLADVLEVPTTDLAPLSRTPTMHELRWHAGLSVEGVAKRVGLTRDHVARILRGEIPIRDEARWADALSVPAATLQRAWEASHAELNQR
jgi:transcriptional regulator with XRE-family HTH domain